MFMMAGEQFRIDSATVVAYYQEKGVGIVSHFHPDVFGMSVAERIDKSLPPNPEHLILNGISQRLPPALANDAQIGAFAGLPELH